MRYFYALLLLAASAAAVQFGAASLVTPPLAATPVQAKSAALKVPPAAKVAENDAEADLRLAQEVLGELSQQYRHLDDVKVTIGDTPKGEEAVAYYTEGEILIDREHTVEIEKILAHEVWHVIDWRDNGSLDWGEDLPPSNQSDYSLRN